MDAPDTPYAPVAGYRTNGVRRLDLADPPRPLPPAAEDLKTRVFRWLTDDEVCCQWEGCEVTELAQLCIDHVEDDGAVDRQERRRKGERLYQHIVKQWETDPAATRARYQVLCFNHNRTKETHRQDRKKLGQTGALPAERSRVQIRLTISQDTDAYLEKHASPTHSKGAIVDELLEFYTSVGTDILAIKEMLNTRLWPGAPATEPLADPVPDVENIAVPTPADVPVHDPPQYQEWTRSGKPSRFRLWHR